PTSRRRGGSQPLGDRPPGAGAAPHPRGEDKKCRRVNFGKRGRRRVKFLCPWRTTPGTCSPRRDFPLARQGTTLIRPVLSGTSQPQLARKGSFQLAGSQGVEKTQISQRQVRAPTLRSDIRPPCGG